MDPKNRSPYSGFPETKPAPGTDWLEGIVSKPKIGLPVPRYAGAGYDYTSLLKMPYKPRQGLPVPFSFITEDRLEKPSLPLETISEGI